MAEAGSTNISPSSVEIQRERFLLSTIINNLNMQETPLEVLDINHRIYHILKRSRIDTLHDLTETEQIKQLGVNSWIEIWNAIRRYIEKANFDINTIVTPQENRMIKYLHIKDEQIINILLSMELPIEELGLSKRTNSVLKAAGINSLSKLLKTTEEVVLDVKNLGSTTYLEIQQKIEAITTEFLEHLIQKDKKKDTEITSNYRCLESLLLDWLSSLNSRTQIIVDERFGLIHDRVLTLEEISKKFGVTRERVRQIEKKSLNYLNKHLFYHDLIDYIEQYKEIIRSNSGIIAYSLLETNVNEKFALKQLNPAGIIRLISQLNDSIIRIPEIQAWTLEDYPFSNVLPSLRALEEILDDEKAPLDWRTLFSIYVNRNTSLIDEEDYLLSAAICASSSNNICLYPDGNWGLKKWQHQIYDDLIIILRKLNRPSHFSELTAILNETICETEKLSDHNIHSCLGRRPEIFVRVGRGTFGLSEWGLENDGSIANAVYRIIKEAGKPLSLNIITTEVLKTWQVQENSIFMAIENDNRFQRIGKSTYCLKEQISNGNNESNSDSVHVDNLFDEGLLKFQEKVTEQENKNTPDVFSEFEKLDQIGMDFFS